MKLTILVDNVTLIDRYFQAEPGLSFLIEDQGTKILFDCGYSDLFLRNARKLNHSLSDLDYVVFSHGHLDHTWGVEPLIRFFTEETLEGRPCKRPVIVAHPDALQSITADGVEIGPLLSRKKLLPHFDVELTTKPLQLTPRLTFLGEIPRNNDFEAQTGLGHKEGTNEPDHLPDDTGLAFESREGLVVITGCSHAGICNMVDHAVRLTGQRQVADIIGGLHLLHAPATILTRTAQHLAAYQPKALHPCHCTDLAAKIALSVTLPVQEIGVGVTLEYS